MKAFPALCLLFVLIYVRGGLDRLGLPDVAGKLIVECALVLLVYPILRQSGNRMAPGWLWVAIFCGLTILSGVASGDGLYQSLLYFRWTVYAYLVFWAVWNARLTREEVLRLNGLILSLWILQVAASLFHVFVLGERVEAHVGLITAGSGSPAAVFPLFAMAYVLAFYCYYKRSVWLVLLGLSFALIGYSSGKRAIYFFLPAVYLGVFAWYLIRERAVRQLRTLVAPAAVFALCIPVLVYGLTDSKRFDHLQGQSIATVITESLEVAEEYDSRVYATGETFGRTANSKALLGRMFGEEWGDYLLGLGPQSMRPSSGDRGKADENIAYGAVGWVENTISVGWPAMLAHVGFYLTLWLGVWRLCNANASPYMSALGFASQLGFAVFFLMYFTYTYSYAMAGWLTFVQMYAAALLLSPKYQEVLSNLRTEGRIPPRRILICARGGYSHPSGVSADKKDY